MDNNKKKLTVVLVLLALVVVFAVLVFTGIINFDSKPTEETSTDDSASVQTDSVNYISKTQADTPYLSTPIDGIYYTMSVDGDVKFFSLENNSFVETEATGTYTTTVTLSEEKISADIAYLERDGKICGYGLYVVTDGTFSLNPYAFFYLRDYGENYASASDSGCMLFVDTTQDDFYSENKLYEESFFFTYDSQKASRSLAEDSRTIGLDGAKRNDYFIFSDKVVDGSADRQLFFSGRFYSEVDTTVDLYRSGGSGNNTDNIRLADDVLGYWAEYSEDGIRYITTDENGFVALMQLDSDEENVTVVKTFENVTRDDILVSGDYIYVISQNLLYSIADDKETEIKHNFSNFAADMFVVEDNTIVLRGYVDRTYAAMIIADVTGEISSSVQNELCRSFVAVSVENKNVIAHVQNSDNFDCYIF